MLKVRVIPILLWRSNSLVKGKNFNSSRRISAVIPSVKIYNSRDVDELIFLDIAATEEDRLPDEELIKEIALECSVPLTVGGGINKLYQAEYLINSGADKIAINTAAYFDPSIITKIAKKFGSQAVVASIDFKKIDNKYYCFSNSGKIMKKYKPSEWAKIMQNSGCGEILLTSIDKEGLMSGYDLEVINEVTSSINIPLIAAGGAGNYQHMLEAVNIGKASAVAASSIFHFTECTPLEAKKFLSLNNISVRK
jgi:cyclase